MTKASTMSEHNMAAQWVKPYGDNLNDGRVQLSFTLPVPLSDSAKEGAKRLAAQMGLDAVSYTHLDVYKRQAWCSRRVGGRHD